MIKCIGSGHRTLKGRSIITGGTAISIVGSCSVTLKRCLIQAKNAIVVQGSGSVIIRNSVIRGRKSAIKILGSGVVKAKNSRIIGRIKAIGTATYVDQGGNSRK